MQFVEVNDEYRQAWDDFAAGNSRDGGLLQSWAWGDFQKSLDNKIFRLAALDENSQIQASALIIRLEMNFEYNYLYCPRGPVIGRLDADQLAGFFEEIKKIARQEKSFMIRLDPAWPLGDEEHLAALGFRKSDREIQPKCSLYLDILPEPPELMAQMKQKTRYNINLAKKYEVKVRISCELSDIEPFWQLTKETAGRDGFKPHTKEHYKKMFEVLCTSGAMSIFSAEFNNQVIACNLMAFFGNTAVYLHGASSNLHREVMAPYLLQWEAILAAKRLGLSYYDFGGINGRTYFNEKWEGITRFKTGFSQDAVAREYVGCFEMVTNPVIYSVYKFIKQIRG